MKHRIINFQATWIQQDIRFIFGERFQLLVSVMPNCKSPAFPQVFLLWNVSRNIRSSILSPRPAHDASLSGRDPGTRGYQSHVLIWSNLRLIRQRQSEGGVHICAPLCPPSQRWQICHPQRKYWELPGHLSGNIWAIWKITFCKWTQIKMYVLPFLCTGSVSG